MRLQSLLLDAGHVPRDYFVSKGAARDCMPCSAGDEVLRVLVIGHLVLTSLRGFWIAFIPRVGDVTRP